MITKCISAFNMHYPLYFGYTFKVARFLWLARRHNFVSIKSELQSQPQDAYST
jgi:hypothetical protein